MLLTTFILRRVCLPWLTLFWLIFCEILSNSNLILIGKHSPMKHDQMMNKSVSYCFRNIGMNCTILMLVTSAYKLTDFFHRSTGSPLSSRVRSTVTRVKSWDNLRCTLWSMMISWCSKRRIICDKQHKNTITFSTSN